MDYEFIFSDETLKAIFDFGIFSGASFVIFGLLLLVLYVGFMEYLDVRRTRKYAEKFFSALEARLSLIEEELTSCELEEESDSFPVGYPGGDLEEWQRQVDGAFADQYF